MSFDTQNMLNQKHLITKTDVYERNRKLESNLFAMNKLFMKLNQQKNILTNKQLKL